MAAKFLHLLVTLLFFSYLIPLNAIPTSSKIVETSLFFEYINFMSKLYTLVWILRIIYLFIYFLIIGTLLMLQGSQDIQAPKEYTSQAYLLLGIEILNREKSLFRFLLIFLTFSLIKQVTIEDNVEGTMEMAGDNNINPMMDFESNDYPGSQANNRHTPRPPVKD